MALRSILERFEGRRVVVLGDLVADLFVYGEISRVSREAPVLILSHRESQLAPGGAANAVHNLWAMGATPIPVGIVGKDSEGEQLLDYFATLNIDTSGIRSLSSYRTPTKTRFLAGTVHTYQQQVLRLDAGSPLKGNVSQRSTLRSLRARLKKANAVLVSDYGYGLVQPELVSEFAERDRTRCFQRMISFTSVRAPKQ